MRKFISAVIGLLTVALFVHEVRAVESTWEYSVQVSAAVQDSPPRITLSWPQDVRGVPDSYTVQRKAPGATSWGPAVNLPGTSTIYIDTSVTSGTAYEYQVVKSAFGSTGYGYIYTGVNLPLTEYRGKVVLIVENTYAAQLAPELARLEQDLSGDGWTVSRHEVARTDSAVNVKNIIKADYNADPANVKAVFLFGHVPVPYSGNIVPDGHSPDHYGAWPADVYYGDMDGTWTDNSVNNSGATDPRNRNVPGDGKFDQSTVPSTVELQVGRVDLANMPGRKTWGGPATFPTELELLRQYLNKDHAFRHKLVNLPRRGVVGDYFGARNGEAFAASGFRNFAPFFGAENITNLNVIYNDAKGVWIPHLSTNAYLWAYGCGAGSYSSIGGLGNSGLYNNGYTTDIVEADVKAAFTMLFGSWLGDWDSEDNIMRGVLATPSYGLTCSWSGRPHWFYQAMGLGETIGYCARLTQNNNTGLYRNQNNSSAGGVHVALMGDPTLRMHPVAPPASLSGTSVAGSATLIWTPSPDSVLGYYVYRAANPSGPFTRLNSSMIASTGFTDSLAPAGTNTYMVRAVKLETSASGTYYNASQGIFWTVGGATVPTLDVTPPTVAITAPLSNATLSGNGAVVTANATDNVGVVGVQFKLDGNNLGSEVLVAPFGLTFDTTTAANGPHSLTAVARDLAGNTTAATLVNFTISNTTASASVWVEDSLPAGASGSANGGDAWTWIGSNPAPFSGSLAHQSALATGLHEHFFNWASATLSVNTGDTLFTYVYLDPANPPSELMLSWNADNWEHRAYWGGNLITYGANDSAGRRYMGALPPVGQWVRLEVPASAVALEGQTVSGMCFSLYGGRATWDYTGKSTQGSTPPPTPVLPTVTVIASDVTATIGTTDNGAVTFARTGDTSAALAVNYTLGGSAVKWVDYRRPEGDMPVSITIPAGSASATMTIVGLTNSTAANPETIVLTLANDAAYTIGTTNSATLSILGGNLPPLDYGTNQPQVSVLDYTTLELPKAGDNALHVLAPTMLELVRINTKQPDPARVDSWDLVDANGQFVAPATAKFTVTVNGQPVAVQQVGFKRRPFYVPMLQRDLRIANYLYLKLASPVADGQTVEVTNPDGTLWAATMRFTATADLLRYSPAIHVNQEGYVPQWSKKAMVGYYLGNLGELDVPTSGGFQLVDVRSGSKVFQGAFTVRPDVGYPYAPTPYQKVYEADFSSFTTPGEYRLVVPGMGASLPFLIDDGIAMAFTRTYALGLYHQRCGDSNELPFTRYTHPECHIAQADIPSPQSAFPFTWTTVSNYAMTINANNPTQIAPALTGEASQLYPFVNKGKLDVRGGHHDAGDYSKYTINSAGLIHYLMFAVDSFPGVAQLDNLGLPESGDGISDLLQEAKWEADFLAKLQDADGGFYFLVYPLNREYESNVLPENGDPQVVWPKNTAVTAASVAALAQTASSPKFKQYYPAEAALYLQKAKLGWTFLTNAIARYGKNGSYQKITHYADNFTHDDELAWAACEMYLATGEAQYQQKLMEWFPNPNDTATYRWGWWRMSESYGNAIRSYAFGVRSGRMASGKLDATYLAKCEAEIKAAGDDQVLRAQQNAYGSSFPVDTKRVLSAGWYFSSEQAFDITVAYQLDPRADYHAAILENMNYEGGCNPVNISYVTGLGWKRQREIVHQYAQNDRRILPPSGIPLGNIQSNFQYLNNYGSELVALCFPSDNAASAPYSFYDRWSDAYNVTTEFVSMTTARSLASLAFLAGQTSVRTQAWTSASARIIGLPSQISTNVAVTASLDVSGLDLSGARIIWEARDQEPAYADSFTFVPKSYGAQWVEVEAQLPDGRRVFAVTNFFATNSLPTVSVTATDAVAALSSSDNATYTFTRAGDTSSALTVNFKLSGTAVKWVDYRRPEGDMPETVTIPAGATSTTLTIVAVANSTSANPQTVSLTLQSSPGYNVGTPDSALVTILSTSTPAVLPTVSVTASDATATIGTTDNAAFTFTRTGDTSSALTVNYTLGGTAVKWVDYRRPEGDMPESIVIPAGAASVTTTIVGVTNSTLATLQTVLLTLSTDAAYSIGSPSSALVTLVSSPVLSVTPTVTVVASDATATIGTADNAAFTFTRTGDTSTALTVNYTLGGSAVKWIDYRRTEGDMPVTVTIPAGAASTTMTIVAVTNVTAANPLTVVLTLAADAAYTLGTPNNATISILSQQPAVLPVVSLMASDADASRVGPDTGVFTFSRTGDTSAPLTVNYTLSGTATKWNDYRRPEGDMPVSVTIPAGAASTTLTIVPVASTNLVGAQTVVLTLASNAAYTVSAMQNATVNIAGNAVPVSSIKKIGNGVKITWASAPGKVYRVAYKNSLTDTVWNDLSGLITAGSTVTTWTDGTAVSSIQRYYTVYVTN